MTSFTDSPQWKSGEGVADFLDTYYAQRGWQITNTSRHEERDLCLGDRHYRRNGRHLLIEYKSGIQTHYTGNVFLETVSVDSAGKAGWVYTCQADFIFYAALLDRKILIIVPSALRNAIDGLKAQFKEVKTGKQQNDGYNTSGVVVPLAYAEQRLAKKVIVLDEGDFDA